MSGMRGATPDTPGSQSSAVPLTRPHTASSATLPSSATPDKLTNVLLANEELRSRNVALLTKNAQMEEQMWRLHGGDRRSPSDVAVDSYAPRSPGAAGPSSEAVTGTLWQFLDIALQGAARARAEARRAHSETLIALDRSFNTRDEGRLKARALLAQASRSSAKLQAAVQQLESEAAAACTAHNADVAAWATRMRLVSQKADAQYDVVACTMRLELQQAEYAHAQDVKKLELENDRIELERAEERGWSKKEVQRLAQQIDDEKNASASANSSASQSAAALTADARRLRERIVSLEEQLQKEKAEKAAEVHRYTELVSQLQQANSKLRQEVGSMAAELEQSRAELSGKLDRLHADKASSTAELKNQLGALQRSKEAEAIELRNAYERLKVEKASALAALHERLRALQADREADAQHLHAKIDRLKSIHTAALAAGSARGRALLYTEALKSPDLLQHSTMTWRGEDHLPVAGSEAAASLQGSPLQYEYGQQHDGGGGALYNGHALAGI